MKYCYQTLLTLGSTLLMIAVYAVNKEESTILYLPKWAFVLGLLGLTVVLTFWGICLCKHLSKDSIEGGIREIEPANSTFLPVYLGYFFVALSVSTWGAMAFIYGIVFVFTFFSQAIYYNPILLLFGYRFYYVTSADGMRCFIITKRQIRSRESSGFQELRRINTMTYIDMEDNR